jgi:hypothetical protein
MSDVVGRAVAHWMARNPDAPSMWEDGAAYSEHRRLYAIADGASASYRSADWAEWLTLNFIDGFAVPPEAVGFDAKEQFRGWLTRCVRRWSELQTEPVHWWEKDKLEVEGPAATFLGLHLRSRDGEAFWQAWSVGDCCLLHVREHAVIASFPLSDPEKFDDRPSLIPANHRLFDRAQRDMLYRCGVANVGDWFFLATDALAQALLRHQDAINWAGLANIGRSGFADLITELRANGRITVDDATLVAVRVDAALAAGEPTNSVTHGTATT